jgi:hypothetical protein
LICEQEQTAFGGQLFLRLKALGGELQFTQQSASESFESNAKSYVT